MKKNKSIFLFICLALVCPAVAFAIVHWYQNNVDDLPYFGKDYQIESKAGNAFRVGDFDFTDEMGKSCNSATLKGKVWVANYFFSNCKTICPIMMPNMLRVQEAFKGNNNLKMISFSVDPDRDSIAQLKIYGNVLGIDPTQWHLLTGNKVLLYRYARNQLFLTASDGDGGPDDFIHSDKIALIDRQGHIRGYYEGTDKTDVQNLIKDIKKLL